MLGIFNALLQSPRLEQRRHKHAEAVTLYADYTINNTNDFNKGLELFRQAVAIEPREIQYRINLIKALIHMRQFDAAEKELDEYNKLDSINNNKIDYEILRSRIDRNRKRSTSSSTGSELND